MVPYPQQMPPMRPPPKKGMSGCMIALLVVGIISVVGALVVGIGIYLFATSTVGKTAIKVMQEGPKLAEKATNAPGTPELRALGCDVAIVLDTRDVGALVSDIIDAGFDSGMPDTLMVACQVRDVSRAPKCDDVAATYIRAVGTASSQFVVSVQRENDKHAICESTYDTSGSLLHTGGL